MDTLVKTIKDLAKRIERLERNIAIRKITVPSSGYFVVDVQISDPATVTNGRIFYNSSTNQLKVGVNGAWKVVTVA